MLQLLPNKAVNGSKSVLECTPTAFKKFFAYLFWQVYVDYITNSILKDKHRFKKVMCII